MCHIVMFPADQLAVPHKKHLNYGLPLVTIQRNDILIFPCAVRYLLLLGYLLHAVVQIPISRRGLEIQLLRRSPHLCLQFIQYTPVIAVQKLQRPGYLVPILLLADISLAGSVALFDMVVQAGALLARVPGQASVAGPQMIKLIQQLNGILHGRCAGIGSEIFRLVLLHHPGKQDTGISLPQRYLDIRIGLIILQQCIVFGGMLLYQIVLQHKGLQLRIRDNIFESGDQGHHLIYHGSSADIFTKIRAHAVMEVNRLAHI